MSAAATGAGDIVYRVVDTAQALEYWLDVSRFSGWKRPSTALTWRQDVMVADAATYAGLGIRHVTTFAAWIDADYRRRFGEPEGVAGYGKALREAPKPPREIRAGSP